MQWLSLRLCCSASISEAANLRATTGTQASLAGAAARGADAVFVFSVALGTATVGSANGLDSDRDVDSRGRGFGSSGGFDTEMIL